MLINDFVVSLFLVSSEWLIIFAAFSVIVPMIISKGQEINSSKPAKFLIISIFTVTASIVVPRLIGTDLDENGDWLGLVIYAAFAWWLPIYIKNTFQYVIDAEKELNQKLISRMKAVVYSLIILFYVLF